jgi:hypothetical protein
LISALFDAAISSRADRLKNLWGAIHLAQAQAKTQASRDAIASARRLAGLVPVTAAEANDLSFLQQFEPQGREPSLAAVAAIKAWSARMDENQEQALRLAQEARAARAQ